MVGVVAGDAVVRAKQGDVQVLHVVARVGREHRRAHGAEHLSRIRVGCVSRKKTGRKQRAEKKDCPLHTMVGLVFPGLV